MVRAASHAAVRGESVGTLGIYRRRRRPERTLAWRTVQGWLATWIAHHDEAHAESVPAFVQREPSAYLECGILAHGFARARCPDCTAELLIAFSCKGRGVCPSCTTKRMAATAAHLVDSVIPQVPMRQWVLALPKRLRPALRNHTALATRVLGIFIGSIGVVEIALPAQADGAHAVEVVLVDLAGNRSSAERRFAINRALCVDRIFRGGFESTAQISAYTSGPSGKDWRPGGR